MRTQILALLLIAAVFCFHRAFQSIAYADDGSATVSATASAGSGSGSTATPSPATPSAADQLHDPTSSPGAAFDDAKAAKKLGWAALAFVLLIFAAKVAGTLGAHVSWLSWLGKGKAAVVVAGVGSVAAGCYNAAASGGAWTAVALAALLGIAHYRDAAPATSS